MNPIFDLVIIGIIVVMVLLNLYHSRDQSAHKTHFLSGLREKFAAFNQMGRKAPVRYHVTAHLSLK